MVASLSAALLGIIGSVLVWRLLAIDPVWVTALAVASALPGAVLMLRALVVALGIAIGAGQRRRIDASWQGMIHGAVLLAAALALWTVVSSVAFG